MGAWQYCECGVGINPTDEEIIDGYVDCPCGKRNEILDGDEMKNDLLKQLLQDVAQIKELLSL